MNAGEGILHKIVYTERDGLYDAAGGVWAADIARAVFARSDGRKIVNGLKALEQAGLVQRLKPGQPFWVSTARGREVDAIMDRISAERGGQFAPMSHSGISSSEANALQWGARSVPILPAGGTGAYA